MGASLLRLTTIPLLWKARLRDQGA